MRLKTIEEEREFSKKECMVYFDFPLIPGSAPRGYKISKVDINGIMIRNDDIERPKGHP
jgi:hypothetical protein